MAFFNFLTKKRKQEKEKEKAGIKTSVRREVTTTPSPAGDRVAEPKIGTVSERVSLLIKPRLTERSRDLSAKGAYVFEVKEEAVKPMIKQAVQELYHVRVRKVAIARTPAKKRRRGLTVGTKKGYKKAIVTLRQGDHIELF